MKYVILIFLLVFVLVTAVAEEINYSLRLEKATVSLQASDGERMRLSVGRLFYKDGDGDTVATEDSYIVEVIDDHSPRIIDALNGQTVSFQLADLDEDKGDEVLAYYFAGGNQYGVKIYKVNGTEVTPLKTQPHSSNMRSVTLRGKDIVVKNQGATAEGVRFFSTETYRIVAGGCKLVREEKQVVGHD
jgi:hypothetical protein